MIYLRVFLVVGLVLAVLSDSCKTGCAEGSLVSSRRPQHRRNPRSLLQQPAAPEDQPQPTDPLAGLDLSSQLGQDRFVLEHHPDPGTYLEIGAHKGKTLSNTYILDVLGWEGELTALAQLKARAQRRSCSGSVMLLHPRQHLPAV